MVHEQFLTDTTDYADIVLPATTFFEHKDLQGAYGHYYLQVSTQAIEPLGECRSNVELFSALAQRMGFEEECFRDTVDSMIDRALDSPNPWLSGITRERLEHENHIRLNFSGNGSTGSADERPFLPFAEGNFQTPSRKAEFYSEALKLQGLDPVGAFTPPVESRHGAKAAGFPLELLARKPDNHLNSTFANIPSVRKMEPTIGMIEMQPLLEGRNMIMVLAPTKNAGASKDAKAEDAQRSEEEVQADGGGEGAAPSGDAEPQPREEAAEKEAGLPAG